MFRIPCLILIQCFLLWAGPVSASDWGQTIGSGGGVGELQMTRAWNKIASDLRVCFGPTSFCDLNAGELKILETALQMQSRCYTKLSFKPLADGQVLDIPACGQNPTFNSKLLGPDPRRSVELEKIRAFTLQSLCLLVDGCPPPAKTVFLKLLKVLAPVQDLFFLDRETLLVQQRGSHGGDILLLRQSRTVEALNSQLQSRLSCPTPPLFQFSNVALLPTGAGLQMSAQVKVSCAGRVSDRRLVLVLTKQSSSWSLDARSVFWL